MYDYINKAAISPLKQNKAPKLDCLSTEAKSNLHNHTPNTGTNRTEYQLTLNNQSGATNRSFLSTLAKSFSKDLERRLPKIRLYSNSKGHQPKDFPLYSESEYLQISKSLQTMLHKSTNDDDYDTGEIQTRRAIDFCRKETEDGIEEREKSLAWYPPVSVSDTETWVNDTSKDQNSSKSLEADNKPS